MKRTKPNKDILEPYWHNPDIYLVYELEYDGVPILPGTLIKIKFERSLFRFDRLVVNTKTNREWIDCRDATLGGWRSFRVNQISGLNVKRSRRKK